MDEHPSDAPAALATEMRVVIGKLMRRLREQSHRGELTGTQVSVLSRLEREGAATITTLARAEGMRPQSMGAVIAALEAAGLVAGTPDPADRRQTLVSVTDALRDLMKTSRTAREDWLSRAIQTRLAPAEQDDLGRALALLRRLAEA